jgi:hypothetical protein
MLLTITGGVAALTYSSFLILALRRTRTIRKGGNATSMMPHSSTTGLVLEEVEGGRWQDAAYYDNYVRNMFPTSINNQSNGRPSHSNSPSRTGVSHNSTPNANTTTYDPNTITEEEMQRQQMLQLLLQRDNHPARTSHSERTFHIDWQQGRDDEDVVVHNPPPELPGGGIHNLSGAPPPSRGYYAPGHTASHSVSSVNTSYLPTPQSTMTTHQQPLPPPPLLRRITGDLQPWDGVWRTAAPVAATTTTTAAWERQGREARRLEIEQGR